MWGAIYTASLMLVVGSALAAAAAVPLIGSNLAFFDQAPERLFFVALALFPLTGFLTLAQLHTAGKRQFKSLAVAALAQSLSQIAFLGLLVSMLEDATLAALLSYGTSVLIASIVLVQRLARVEHPSWSSPFNGIALIARYSAKYYAARVGNLVDVAMGTLLLAFVADSAAVGICAAVTAIALKMLLGAESIEAAVLPRVAADPKESVQLVMKCYRLSLLLTLCATIALCTTAPWLVPLLFSSAFADGVSLAWTMAPGLVLQGGSAMLMAYYRRNNRPDLCSLAVWIGMCVNGVGFFALYPETGLNAAGLSMSLGLAARNIFLTLTFARETSVRLMELLIPKWADWQLIRHSVDQVLSRFDALRTRA
jgi:O-antigen/teichoic acid export membrane protein